MTEGFENNGEPAASAADSQTAASVSVAWLIAGNKPFYPLYIYWLTGEYLAACLMILTAPLFAGLALLARRNGAYARIGVPALGILDTMLAAKVFGPAGGVGLFLMPCVLLAGVALHRSEARTAAGLAALSFLAGVFVIDRLGAPLSVWSDAQSAALLSLNVYSVAALGVFIVWRFASLPKG